MARALKPNEILAKALNKAKEVEIGGIVKGTDLDRSTRQILSREGWLTEVIRNWYMLVQPIAEADIKGTSSAWYANFWTFLSCYLKDRFGDGYCLSAESSVDRYSGETLIPTQVIVLTQKKSNQNLPLPFETSIFMHDRGFPEEVGRSGNLNSMKIEEAIVRLGATYFQRKPANAEIAIHSVLSADVSKALLNMNSPAASGRLIGIYRHLGKIEDADRIEQDSKAAGIQPKISNPFESEPILFGQSRLASPYVGRIKAMWSSLRDQIIAMFPPPSKIEQSKAVIEKIYEQDAYHSLSIEGYQVTVDLIQKIAEGSWDPNIEPSDQEQLDAMAAKGYYEAFKCVVNSIQRSHNENVGSVFSSDLANWYRELFSPLVKAGLAKPGDLAGYRSGQVFIRGSRHVPPAKEAVLDAMESLFELISSEPEASVRAVLGHYLVGFIHPYMDGNGRIARFLMNLMLVHGGYNWTVIRVEKRTDYLAALEKITIQNDISDFVKVISTEMSFWELEMKKIIKEVGG